MNSFERRHAAVFCALIATLLFAAARLVYRSREDLLRYSQGPRALARHIIRMPSHRLPWCRPMEPHFTIIGSLKGRKIIQKVIPDYPEWAVKEGFSTQVGLNFRVNEQGEVAPNIWVVKMGQPEFDAAAIRALKQWRFAPQPENTPEPVDLPANLDPETGEPGIINFTFSLPEPVCT